MEKLPTFKMFNYDSQNFTHSNSVSKLVDFGRVPALAGASGPTIDNGLSGHGCVGELLPVSHDEAVGQGRSGTLCPTRTAIVRNVLVHGPRQVVGAVDVAPVPGLWKS